MQLLAPTMGFLLIAVANVLLIKFAIMKAANESGTTIIFSRIQQMIPKNDPQKKLGDYASA
jgi:hypothetical protein